MSRTVPFHSRHFSISTQFKCQEQFHFIQDIQFLTFKLCTYSKMSWKKWNCSWHLNWHKAHDDIYICSTMGVACQSRRFNCLFWHETRQRILGHEISPYPEVVRGGEWELTTWPRERQGPEERAVGSWSQESREAGSRSWRGSTEGQSTPDTEQRGEETNRVQWRRVSRCLIPVALWNFR